MDALILSCGTGGGHNAAAKAIAEELDTRGHHTVICNPYTLKSSKLAENIDKTYIAAARDIPGTFGCVYKLGDLYRRLPFRSPVYFINHGMDEILQRYLQTRHFDVVIMTHLFAAEILTNMKCHGIPLPKTMFVATDYVCTPFTEETECDAYVIPARDLTGDFVSRGLPAAKLYPLGIPTGRAFREPETREAAKARLGLRQDQKYILIAGGSMGGGKIEKAITKLQAYCAGRSGIALLLQLCGGLIVAAGGRLFDEGLIIGVFLILCCHSTFLSLDFTARPSSRSRGRPLPRCRRRYRRCRRGRWPAARPCRPAAAESRRPGRP